MAWVCLLRGQSGRHYIGATEDVEARLRCTTLRARCRIRTPRPPIGLRIVRDRHRKDSARVRHEAGVKELSWKAQNRLHARYMRLKARGKHENKVKVAVARELCAFVWELHQVLRDQLPASDQDQRAA